MLPGRRRTTGLLVAAVAVASAGVTAIVPSAQAAPTTIYVSKKGSNSNPGTEQRPLRTIQAAVDKAVDGATILVARGSYHESVTVSGVDDLTIRPRGAGQVWLDGSRVVKGWARSGGAWVVSGWNTRFNASPTYSWNEPDNSEAYWQFVNPAYPMAAHPDQVWVAGRRLAQVGALSQVSAGRFYVDHDARKLYIGTDPSGREVRASTIAKALSIRSAGTAIQGIGVRRFAPSVPHMGAVTVEARKARLRDMVISDNATTGLHAMNDDIRLTRVRLVRNGMMGMTSNRADGLRLNRVRVQRNNLERFNYSPSAGGAKLGRTSGILVRNSVFSGNHGTGLWFDESAHNVEVYGSRMLGNARHGLSLEISGKVTAAGNVIAGNKGYGVKVNNTDTVHLWNNTVVRNRDRALNIVQDDRDLDAQGSYRDLSLPLTWLNRPVTVRNNILESSSSAGSCLLCVEDYSGRFTAEELRITTNGNVYARTSSCVPRWAVVWARASSNPAVFTRVADFRAATDEEARHAAFTGERVVTAAYRPTKAVRAKAASVALPLPTWLAQRLGRAAGVRHLGAWVD